MEPQQDTLTDLIAVRRAKIEALRAMGVDPFGGRFDTSGSIAEIRARFAAGSPRIATWGAAISSISATAPPASSFS